MTADIILFNGKVYTAHKSHAEATAVAIKDGKFAAVGNDQTVMALRTEGTTVIDLQKSATELAF